MPLLPTKHGWIGIDAGASTLKLAQLTRQAGGVRIARAAIIPRGEAWARGQPFSPAGSSQQEVESALAVVGELGGRDAAATLSMSVCDVAAGRRVPVGAGAPCVRESWQAEASTGDDGWYTLAAAESPAIELCENLLRAGLSCRTVDAMPHALARAVALRGANTSEPIGILDWGYSDALFCVAVSGRPVYVRRLKGCGLCHLEETLSEELGLTRGDVCELAATAADSEGPVRELLSDSADPLVAKLGAELGKTIGHLRSHRKSIAPERIDTFGGGSVLGIEPRLAAQVGCPVATWAMPSDDRLDAPVSLLGPAAALSALVWEDR